MAAIEEASPPIDHFEKDDQECEASCLAPDEREELLRIAGAVSAAPGGAQTPLEERFAAILGQYQEQPQLLDGSLGPIVEPLASMLATELRKGEAFDAEAARSACALLWSVAAVRGPKTVARFLPTDVTLLFPATKALLALSQQDGTPSTPPRREAGDGAGSPVGESGPHATPRDSAGIPATPPADWRATTLILVWLSQLVLVPFDLARIDRRPPRRGASHPPLLDELASAAGSRLGRPPRERDAAALLLGRLLTRPDAMAARARLVDALALQIEGAREGEPTRPGAPPPPPPIGDGLTSSSVLPLGDASGAMRALGVLLASGSGEDLAPVARRALAAVARHEARAAASVAQPGSQERRLRAKLTGRAALVLVPSPYTTPLDESLVEDALGRLLGALGDRDTVVRWSAAKGVGRLVSRLPPDLAAEVVGDLLGLEQREEGGGVWEERGEAMEGQATGTGTESSGVLPPMRGAVSPAPLAPRHDDALWHGTCLALAECCRRGALPGELAVPLARRVAAALRYDLRRGAASVGAHVRDAAAFVAWSLARASAAERGAASLHANLSARPVLSPGAGGGGGGDGGSDEGGDGGRDGAGGGDDAGPPLASVEALPPLTNALRLLAPELAAAACLDREVGCRRAAAAAYQEAVGRGGPAAVPGGIAVLVVANFFTVSSRQSAQLSVAPQVALLGSRYFDALARGLLDRSLVHWDPAVRSLGARCLARLVAADERGILAAEAAPRLARVAATAPELEARHGAIAALAELLPELRARSPRELGRLAPAVRAILPALQAARATGGRGGDVLRTSLCRMLETSARTGVHGEGRGPKGFQGGGEPADDPVAQREEEAAAAYLAEAARRDDMATQAAAAAAVKARWEVATRAAAGDEGRAGRAPVLPSPTPSALLGDLENRRAPDSWRRGAALCLAGAPPAGEAEDGLRALRLGRVAAGWAEADARGGASSAAAADGDAPPPFASPDTRAAAVAASAQVAARGASRPAELAALAACLAALGDHETDARGDVGSWVRLEAARGIARLSGGGKGGEGGGDEGGNWGADDSPPGMDAVPGPSPSIADALPSAVPALVHASMERIGRVRAAAVAALRAVCATVPGDPGVAAVRAALASLPASNDAEREPAPTLRALATLLHEPALSRAVLAPLGWCLSGKDVALARAARDALTAALAGEGGGVGAGGASGAAPGPEGPEPSGRASDPSLLLPGADSWRSATGAMFAEAERLVAGGDEGDAGEARPTVRGTAPAAVARPVASHPRATAWVALLAEWEACAARPRERETPPLLALSVALAEAGAPPGGREAAAAAWERLLAHVRAAARGAGGHGLERQRLAATALAAVAAHARGGPRRDSLRALCRMSASRFPILRRHAADALHETLLMWEVDETESEGRPAGGPTESVDADADVEAAEAAADVVASVPWEFDREAAARASDEVLRIMGAAAG